MRCQFCGSTSLHADTQHKNFSAGKAVAGAVVFGVVGAAAGLVGKEQKGYRCGACGSFMQTPMDTFTEMRVDSAIRDAEAGRSRSMFDYYKRQYANIQANIPAQSAPVSAEAVSSAPSLSGPAAPVEKGAAVKRSYRYGFWQPDCPIWVEGVTIKETPQGDVLSLTAWNQSGKTIRSAYFRVSVLDDTGDEVGNCQCVYQNLSVPPAEERAEEAALPREKEFPLHTDLAYRVVLTCEKVAFEGDEVWRASEHAEETKLPPQELLTKESFPRIRYVHTRYATLQKEEAKRRAGAFREPEVEYAFYLPAAYEGFWLCDCGHPARAGAACPYCGDTYPQLEEAFSQETLRLRQQEAVKERAARRAQETQALYDKVIAAQKEQEEKENEAIYREAATCMEADTVEALEEAAHKFRSISGWKDAGACAERCTARIGELKEAARIAAEEQAAQAAAQKAAQTKRRKKAWAIALPVLAACIIAGIVLVKVVIPAGNYKKAAALEANGHLPEAALAFGEMGGYGNARERSLTLWRQIAQRQVAVSAGDSHTVGLKSDGTVVAVGSNYSGECKVSGWTDIVAVSAGDGHTVGLKSDGTVVAVGSDGDGQCKVTGWTDIVAVSAGGSHTVGLKSDGTVVAVGDNDYGPCNVSDWTDIVAVSAGDSHTVGLKADGTVVAVGYNRDGRCNVSDWTDIVAVSTGMCHTVGLKVDGTVVAVGSDGDGQCKVTGWTDIVAVSAGDWHTVGLKSDGTVLAAGYNKNGRCDVSDWSNIKLPEK